jgi:hypothetical protein
MWLGSRSLAAWIGSGFFGFSQTGNGCGVRWSPVGGTGGEQPTEGVGLPWREIHHAREWLVGGFSMGLHGAREQPFGGVFGAWFRFQESRFRMP